MSVQARQDSNPQHPVLETGALPVGATGLLKNTNILIISARIKSPLPAARRIAPRYLTEPTNDARPSEARASNFTLFNTAFLVERVLPARGTVFLELQLGGGIFLVLAGRVILSLALLA